MLQRVSVSFTGYPVKLAQLASPTRAHGPRSGLREVVRPVLRSERNRVREYDAGSVERMNSCTSLANRCGWSLCGKWPGVRDHLDAGLRREGGGVGGVPDRDDPVVAAPDDRHRHLLGEVGAVGHGDDLATPVDDGAHDVADRGAGVRVAERVVDLGDLVEVAGRLQSGARQRLEAGLADVADPRQRQQRP